MAQLFKPSQIEVRELRESEFEQFERLFRQEEGCPAPPRAERRIAVIVKEGCIVGYATLQQVWHAEPWWIHPTLRGRGGFGRLARVLYQLLPSDAQGVLCYTTNRRVARLAKRVGLEFMPSWLNFRWVRR